MYLKVSRYHRHLSSFWIFIGYLFVKPDKNGVIVLMSHLLECTCKCSLIEDPLLPVSHHNDTVNIFVSKEGQRTPDINCKLSFTGCDRTALMLHLEPHDNLLTVQLIKRIAYSSLPCVTPKSQYPKSVLHVDSYFVKLWTGWKFCQHFTAKLYVKLRRDIAIFLKFIFDAFFFLPFMCVCVCVCVCHSVFVFPCVCVSVHETPG